MRIISILFPTLLFVRPANSIKRKTKQYRNEKICIQPEKDIPKTNRYRIAAQQYKST
jgi:hypothetical protein